MTAQEYLKLKRKLETHREKSGNNRLGDVCRQALPKLFAYIDQLQGKPDDVKPTEDLPGQEKLFDGDMEPSPAAPEEAATASD